MSRIDILTEPAKEVLRIASVIGYTFELAMVKQLVDPVLDETNFKIRLKELEGFDLINPEESGAEIAYRFKQNLIQEVTYDSLLFARRRKLHHQVATFFEGKYRDQLEEMYEVLTHHFSQSHDNNKTRFYAYKAGQKARAVFAHENAIDYFQICVDTLQGADPVQNGERSYFIEKIGDTHEASGNHAEATSTFKKALQQWRRAYSKNVDFKAISVDITEGTQFKTRKSALNHKIAVSYERNSDYDSG
jgi:predicted ATPase